MGDITLRKAVEEYKDIYMASRNFAQKTRVEYLHDIEDLVNFLEQQGIREVKSIRLPSLERYLAELDRRGNAGSTRKRKVISIRSFLWYLYQDQYLRVNLGKKLIPPFTEARSLRYLTKFEYERLLMVCAHNARDFALIQLLLQTGIKLAELAHLTVNDVELYSSTSKDGYLHIFGSKTKKRRIILINAKVHNSLSDYFQVRKSLSNKALFTNRFGNALGLRGIEKIVSKYLLKAGVQNASVQSLRHTCAVQNLLLGADLKSVQEMLGYSDRRAIAHYLPFVKKKPLE